MKWSLPSQACHSLNEDANDFLFGCVVWVLANIITESSHWFQKCDSNGLTEIFGVLWSYLLAWHNYMLVCSIEFLCTNGDLIYLSHLLFFFLLQLKLTSIHLNMYPNGGGCSFLSIFWDPWTLHKLEMEVRIGSALWKGQVVAATILFIVDTCMWQSSQLWHGRYDLYPEDRTSVGELFL
jgi:hypothetical protein